MSNYISLESRFSKSEDKKFKSKYKLFISYYNIILYNSKIFLLIILFTSYKIPLFKRNKNKKIYSSSIKSNYSLYNYFKHPQISIIIPYNEKKTIDKNIIKLLKNLLNQTFNNIEIIFISSKYEFKKNKKLKNLYLSEKRIIFKKTKRKDLIINLFSLMKLIKGKFVLILNKFFNFKRNDLVKFYELTKGKIKNIFEFKINRESLFLIKSKILRDINDNSIYFKNFSSLIKYITSLPEPQLNYISVSLSTNNHYTSLAYVCMTSVLYSKNDFTYISFYLIISKEFSKKNIDFLTSLYEQYDYFNITILKIDNRYDRAFISRYLSKETYFRCSLGELIPYLNKIIYLDTDVIVYKDLTNLYNLNFNDKMILGQSVLFENGFYRINPGIILLNLKKMREINMEKKVLNIVINQKKKYNLHDQAIINIYFKKYLGVFPPENHARPYNETQSIKFNNISGHLYNNDYFLFSWKNPTLRHFFGKYKPTHLDVNNIFKEDWWYFARLSKYFVQKTNKLNKIFNYKD